jgi:hypothetical protein
MSRSVPNWVKLAPLQKLELFTAMRGFARKRPLAHERDPNYRAGRPSEYRPEFCERVKEHMAKGKSLTAFAGSIGQSKDTIYEWIATHPAFSDAVTRARAARVDALETRMLSANNGGTAATSIFALKNADPDEWREVRYANIEHSVNLDALTDEQLAAIALGRHQAPMIDVTPKKPRG